MIDRFLPEKLKFKDCPTRFSFNVNNSGMKLSITSLFSVQIMSYLGASDIVYSDMIDSFISEVLKYESSVIQSLTEKPYRPYYLHPIFASPVVIP